MAQSRLSRVSDIHRRIKGLLETGAMKVKDKPIWYTVYETFPPLERPTMERPRPDPSTIKQIFYPEDKIRAKFFQKYGVTDAFSLDEKVMSRTVNICQTFVDTYQRLEASNSDMTEGELMSATERQLELSGIHPDLTKKDAGVAMQKTSVKLSENLNSRQHLKMTLSDEEMWKKACLEDVVKSESKRHLAINALIKNTSKAKKTADLIENIDVMVQEEIYSQDDLPQS